MLDYYHTVQELKVDQYDVVVDWTYETVPLDSCFDETVFDISDMAERCNRGVDTHYITRVRAFYNGHELGCSTLGSCYASDCYPEDNIRSGLDGYLPQLIEEAVDQAREETVRMIARLKKDFLGVI